MQCEFDNRSRVVPARCFLGDVSAKVYVEAVSIAAYQGHAGLTVTGVLLEEYLKNFSYAVTEL